MGFHYQFWSRIKRVISPQYLLLQYSPVRFNTTSAKKGPERHFFPFCKNCNVYNPSNNTLTLYEYRSLLALTSFWSAVNNRFVKSECWKKTFLDIIVHILGQSPVRFPDRLDRPTVSYSDTICSEDEIVEYRKSKNAQETERHGMFGCCHCLKTCKNLYNVPSQTLRLTSSVLILMITAISREFLSLKRYKTFLGPMLQTL